VFTDRPKVTAAPLVPGVHAFIIDNALAEPETLVQFAQRTRGAFRASPEGSAPGLELRMAESFSTKFEEFFRQHLRGFFDARRSLERVSRLSIHTRAPHTLPPSQWLPQRIGTTLHREQTVVVAQLFLSADEKLGGLSFFFPKRTVRETFNVINDSYALNSSAFEGKYRLRADDMRASNDLFHLAQTIPAKFNRMVIFDGAMFHASQITRETPLSDSATDGRLTFDAFLTCKRHSDGTADRRRV
jgi:hypothetical protein